MVLAMFSHSNFRNLTFSWDFLPWRPPTGSWWGWIFQASDGTIAFLHTPCFHKLLLRFSHYPKQASEPGREPWPRPFWPMTFLPLACATHLASPLTMLHSSPLTPDPSPSPGLLTPWPLSLESLPLAPRPLTLTNELWHLALSPGPWTFTLCPGAIDVEMQDHTVNP